MHVLVVNDDGPPSSRLSPYIRPFVNALHAAGHLVSVAIPASSRSWIGKAHLIEASLKATYVPADAFRDDGTWASPSVSNSYPSPEPESSPAEPAWVVIQNGTPASCVQLGLFNLFPDRPPFDLVISGPNHGRNASTIYNLSSGTVGGALEAATCGKRGIAVSFGSKDPQPADIISAAARLSVRVIDHLVRNWDDGVELYNLNIPMRLDVEERAVKYTRTLPYYWSKGCLYAEVPGEGTPVNGDAQKDSPHLKERHFAWSADLTDMKKGLLASPEGTDAHTVLNGFTSVTPLTANFSHIPGLDGEIELS